MRKGPRKITPETINSFNNLHHLRQLSPDSQNLDSSRVLNTEDSRVTPLKNNSSEEVLLQDQDELFKNKIQKRSLFWMSAFIIAGVWLIGLSVIYLLHIKTDYSTIESYLSETVTQARATCTSNANCQSPTPFCDTLYSHKCSTCLSSSDCTTDPTKTRCDVYGTRDCYECLADRHCSGTLVCDIGKTRKCVQCVRNDDCTAISLTTCNTGTNTCS